jgi:integron integrase
MPGSTGSQQPKLLDQLRQVLRVHYYSIHTERAYLDWIVRYVRFHRMRSRDDFFPPEPKIEAFLTDLAVNGNVAAATQYQAMNALVFLYKRVLNHSMQGSINAVRADKKINVPVVMTREEVASVISLMDGTAQLVAKLLYGSGLRIMEAVRLRVQDIDFQLKPLTVRSGKGDKDRFTTVPATLTPLLQNHLARVRTRHQQDLAQGHAEVYLPHALDRKYPHAPKEWGWQYVFPAWDLSVDLRSGITRRHHVDPSVINKAIKVAVRRAGLMRVFVARSRHNNAVERHHAPFQMEFSSSLNRVGSIFEGVWDDGPWSSAVRKGLETRLVGGH